MIRLPSGRKNTIKRRAHPESGSRTQSPGTRLRRRRGRQLMPSLPPRQVPARIYLRGGQVLGVERRKVHLQRTKMFRSNRAAEDSNPQPLDP